MSNKKNINTKKFLRRDFAKHIRSQIDISSCSICGTTEDLEVHHCYKFYDQLLDTLEMLDLKYHSNWNDYTKSERKSIRYCMLGSQLVNENKVLCHECHRDIHINEDN